MNYITTTELSKIWNISSRVIATYCEKGRISNAVKKGKTWLIPANAQRPIDKRKATKNATSTVVSIDENVAEKGISSVYNKIETENSDNTYYAGGLYENLGLTRDALRYYEKIGLIEPKRQIENLYREFDINDIFQCMAIDFHKKRGFNLLETKNLMKQSNQSDSSAILAEKLVELEQKIYNQQCIFERLKETKDLYECARTLDGNFEIRDFPLYSVLKSFDNMYDVSNYGSNILRKLDGEDLLSHLVRVVSADSTGYTGSKMCIIKKVTDDHKGSPGQFLESGRCMYTAVLESHPDVSFGEKIFFSANKWANEHGVEHKGIGYYFIRFPVLEHNIGRQINELWILLK